MLEAKEPTKFEQWMCQYNCMASKYPYEWIIPPYFAKWIKLKVWSFWIQMYRLWEKEYKKYSAKIETIANDLKTRVKKINDKDKLKKLHKEWLYFIEKHDECISKSHRSLIVFWDKKV